MSLFNSVVEWLFMRPLTYLRGVLDMRLAYHTSLVKNPLLKLLGYVVFLYHEQARNLLEKLQLA